MEMTCFSMFFLLSLTFILSFQNEETPSKGSVLNTTIGSITPAVQLFTLTDGLSATYLHNPTLEMMEFYIQNDQRVKSYLKGFLNEFQRKVVETQIKYCPYTSLCNFDVDVTTDYNECCESCRCLNCESTRTCCPSILGKDIFVNITDETSTNKQLNKFQSAQHYKEPICISQYLSSGSSDGKGFLAISDCPDNTDRTLKHNCSRSYDKLMAFESFLPVISNASLEIFRNKYCALCNSVTEEYFVPFIPILFCKDKDDLLLNKQTNMDLLFSSEKCSLKFENTDTRVSVPECKHVTSQCNVTGNWTSYEAFLDVACNAYQSIFRHGKFLFRNVFCAICNGMTPDTITCIEGTTVNAESFPFSGLLRMDFDQKFKTAKTSRTTDEILCADNQIFDSLMERCKDLVCPQMKLLQNRECINIYESVKSHFSYIFYIRLQPKLAITLSEAFDNNSNWLLFSYRLFWSWKFPQLRTCDAQMAFKSHLKFGKRNNENIAGSSLRYIDIRLLFSKSNWQKPWEIIDKLLKIHGTTANIVNEKNESVEYDVYVTDQEDHLFNSIKQLVEPTLSVIRKQNAQDRITVLTEHAIAAEDGFTILPFSIPLSVGSACTENASKIKVIQFTSCPKVNMSTNDIPWTEESGGIAVGDLKISNTEFYNLDDDHIMICAEAFKKITEHLTSIKEFNAEIIISIICSSLSILSLFLTCLIFCLIPALRVHLPGKNNLSLVVVLLIAQVTFLVGSLNPMERYSISCKVIGLLTHFIWLCSIFWMNVCTYHVFRVLTQTTVVVSGQEWKRFIFYHVFVVSMAAVFVLANVISSITSSAADLGYGGKFCYLTSQLKVVVTFVLPTALVIITNLLMFIRVLVKLKRAPSIHKSVKHDRNDIVIFSKLSTITGMTWVFGVLYSWSSITAFSYLFILLNASQGVFIMLAFVVNRRVFAMFKDFKENSRQKS